MATKKYDELLIHEIMTSIVLKDVKRIQSLQRLDASDVSILEKYAKIYGVLMDQLRENKKTGLFNVAANEELEE